jgi:hypothetical protein
MAGPGAHAKLMKALTRLRDTRVKQELRISGEISRREFGIIDSWVVVDQDSKEVAIEIDITISEWVFETFAKRDFFRIPYGYFQPKSPIMRRIYELAGLRFSTHDSWTVGLEQLLRMADATDKNMVGFPWGAFYYSQSLPGLRINIDKINDIFRLSPKY